MSRATRHPSLVTALMPAHAEVMETLSDFAASKLRMFTGEECSGASVTAAEPSSSQPSTMDSQLSSLQGNPQLVAIAQIDRGLALAIKALLDLTEEGDFEHALNATDHVHFLLRDLQLTSRADESGVAR